MVANPPGSSDRSDHFDRRLNSDQTWLTIDRICDSYEAIWQSGVSDQEPDQEDFLDGVSLSWRDRLVTELDAIDEAYRVKRDRPSPEPPSPRALQKGDHWLGRFRIERCLGSGGAGSVWLAEDTRLGRRVALKIPHASRVDDQAAKRFEREAKASAAISHPNVVQIHEVLVAEGLPVLVQQYLEGETLDECMRQGGLLHSEMVVDWMIQMADAVNAAHELGIIHRDLKPANVMVTRNRPVILDFGLASHGELSAGLTLQGTVLGTPAYMSPEQAGGDADASAPATDVYSLGAMLYEMLVGSPPFHGSAVEILHSVQSDPPTRPRQLRPSVPRDLETISMHCLRKSATARYRSALELADDLRRYQNGLPIKARCVSVGERAWAWFRRHPVTATLTLVTPVIVGLLVAWGASHLERRRLRLLSDRLMVAERAHQQAQTELRERMATVHLSRAAQELARGDQERAARLIDQLHDRPGWQWNLLRSLSQSPSTDYTHAGLEPPGHRICVMEVAPDESCFYSGSSAGTIVRWDRSPDPSLVPRFRPTLIHRGGIPTDMAVSPDGSWVAWIDTRGHITLWNANAQRVDQTIRRPSWHAGYALGFSPDSQWLVAGGGFRFFRRNSDKKVRPWIAAYSLQASDRGRLIAQHVDQSGTDVSKIQFTSRQHFLVARGNKEKNADQNTPGAIERWTLDGDQLVHVDTLARGTSVLGVASHPATGKIAWTDSSGCVTFENERVPGSRRRWALSREPLHGVDFSADGTQLCLAGRDGRVRRISMTEPSSEITYQGHRQTVFEVAFWESAPDGSQVVSCGDDGVVRFWDETQREIRESVVVPCDSMADLVWRSDSRGILVAANQSEGVNHDHSDSMIDESHLKLPVSAISVDAFRMASVDRLNPSADGTAIAMCGQDRLLILDNARTKPTIQLGPDPPSYFGASLIGERWAVSGYSDPNRIPDVRDGVQISDLHLRLFDRQTQELVATRVIDHGKLCRVIQASPDGRTLAIGDDSGRLHWLSIDGAQSGTETNWFESPMNTISAHQRVISDFDWSADSNHLAAVSWDGTCTWWRIDRDSEKPSAVLVHRLLASGRHLNSVSIHPRGDAIVTAGDDRVVRFWDPRSGDELFSLYPQPSKVVAARFSPDGTCLAVGLASGKIEVFHLDDLDRSQN